MKFLFILFVFSELWRKENTVQHSLSSLKDELLKSDQALRSMAGKVICFSQWKYCNHNYY